MHSFDLPLLQSPDLLIFGSSSTAVAAAVAARRSGLSVFLVSDRPYFGVESAGTLELEGLTGEGGAPVRPGALKHALEKRLLRHGIGFVFLARPVALLPDGEGRLDGVVIASRTALYAIRARGVLDATRHGLVAALPGLKTTRRRPRFTGGSLRLLSREEQPLAPGAALVGSPVPFAWKGEEALPLQAQRWSAPITESPSDIAGLAGVEHRFRSRLALDASLFLTAESPVFANQPEEGDGLASDPMALPQEAFAVADHLWIIGDDLPLDAEGLARLHAPDLSPEFGGRIGEWIAAALADKEAPGAMLEPTGKLDGRFGFAESFVRGNATMLRVELPLLPTLGKCDVVVAGGGTGGAPAGIAAARAGAKTVVLETQHGLGGVGTLGLIASYYHGNKVGFTEQLNEELHEIDPSHGATDKTARWNPELKMAWYQQRLLEAGGEAWFGSFAFGVRRSGERIDGLLVSTPFGCGVLETGCVVDATGNADIAAAAGAPCRVISGDHAGVQGTGLSPRRPAIPYVNSDFTFIDDSDLVGVTHAFVNARARFAENEFDTIPLVNSRERRQIIGELELSPLDFLAGRTFSDTINIARSNFDSHGFVVHPVFIMMPPDTRPLEANVPLRCLMPQGVGGLLVTGLGMSAHRDAIPVIRMQADVQNQGYAAGVAAAMAAKIGGDLKGIEIGELQRHLIATGCLPHEASGWGESFPLPPQTVREAVRTTPLDLFSTAVLFAHPQESRPLLLEVLANPASPEQEEEVALVLGLMGCSEAAPVLIRLIGSRPWDDGWNYRGMGQFGMSLSRMDGLILALGKTGAADAVEPIAEKIAALGGDAAFSHCRAVAVAAADLRSPRLAAPLAALLEKPTLQGHAITSTEATLENAHTGVVQDEPRNLSLRELYLAKGLYLSGDCNGLGRAILERYTQDLRGLYARHAVAVLREELPGRNF
ncbi:MAG TPA: FAD-dependent oxidoreductase [Chthoniobacteraceae bacterium]|nr:FAD-dependent oxidoreductase [Chthoniobacteraceae bacterium]